MQVIARWKPSSRKLTVSFSQELPEIPIASLRCTFPFPLQRSSPLKRIARAMARANAGRWPVELENPAEVYLGYLQSLVTVPGVLQVVASNRYALKVQVADCFDKSTVAQSLAKAVCSSFYPDEDADFSLQSPVDEKRPSVFVR